MDASCKIQRSIHVFNITNKSMCPDFWVHIISSEGVFMLKAIQFRNGNMLLYVDLVFKGKIYNIVKSAYACFKGILASTFIFFIIIFLI